MHELMGRRYAGCGTQGARPGRDLVADDGPREDARPAV